ncbi:hypothetical protein T01_9858 [Trichinella spiralis]|uniref:Uncharacterized protein n=1 Tax=Trichinella spiralis TaxID=6334 RepID=A0A0V1AJ29_TRISP|nr:hypothetical protein T01_9858 [Trichinella spiralis]
MSRPCAEFHSVPLKFKSCLFFRHSASNAFMIKSS